MYDVPLPLGIAEEFKPAFMQNQIEVGSRKEIEHIHTALGRGTSADWQGEVYAEAVVKGVNEQEVLIAVVDFLTKEPMQGLQ